MPKKSVLTTKQNVQLYEFMKTVCDTVDNWNGKTYAKYKSGWSDEDVARVFSLFPVTPVNVRNVRRQFFGNTRIPKKPKPAKYYGNGGDRQSALPITHGSNAGTKDELIKVLAARVKRLEEDADQREKRLVAVEDYLTRGYSADTKGM